jgi:hypothetical protein
LGDFAEDVRSAEVSLASTFKPRRESGLFFLNNEGTKKQSSMAAPAASAVLNFVAWFLCCSDCLTLFANARSLSSSCPTSAEKSYADLRICLPEVPEDFQLPLEAPESRPPAGLPKMRQ